MKDSLRRRAPARPAHTLSDLHAAHIARMRVRCREATLTKADHMWRACLLPWFGPGRPIDDLSRGEVQEWIYLPNQTRRPTHTRNCIATGRAGYNQIARAYEWTEKNPFAAVELPPSRVRERVLTDREITDGMAWLAAEMIMGANPARRHAARAIQALIITGSRLGEILYLDGSELDLGAAMIVLAPERHKTGSRTGREKRIFLSPEAVSFFRSVGVPSRGRVFRCSFGTFRRTYERLRKEIGAPDITPHDFRRTYSTLLAEAGIDSSDVAAVLGQKSVAISRRHYRHIRDARKREIAAVAGSLLTERRGQ